MLVKFEQTRILQTSQYFELFDKKEKEEEEEEEEEERNGFLKNIFDKALTPFWKMFL